MPAPKPAPCAVARVRNALAWCLIAPFVVLVVSTVFGVRPPDSAIYAAGGVALFTARLAWGRGLPTERAVPVQLPRSRSGL